MGLKELIEMAGYEIGHKMIPETLPGGSRLLKVGEVKITSDKYFDGMRWCPVTAPNKPVISYAVICIRFEAAAPVSSTWLCNNGSCQQRENDTGHSCYWCGNKQS